ncbi:hypothetical protein ACEE18_12180, partial [Corynebacterium freneyi]
GHTSALDPLLGELGSECSDVEPPPLSVPLFSSVDRGVTYHPGDAVHVAAAWTSGRAPAGVTADGDYPVGGGNKPMVQGEGR